MVESRQELIKVIEFDAACKSCNETGIYVGMAERDGAGVICNSCEGTGKIHEVIRYTIPTGRKMNPSIRRVYQTNPGIVIGEGHSTTYDDLKLEHFGGMPYGDWLNGENFPAHSENRLFTCPAWWYQSADYEKKPDWKECIPIGSFSSCPLFSLKWACWERFDKEHENDNPSN